MHGSVYAFRLELSVVLHEQEVVRAVYVARRVVHRKSVGNEELCGILLELLVAMLEQNICMGP